MGRPGAAPPRLTLLAWAEVSTDAGRNAAPQRLHWPPPDSEGQGGGPGVSVAEKINPPYISRVLRLTLLAPEMLEAILDGRQPKGVTLPGLLEPFPVEWERQ